MEKKPRLAWSYAKGEFIITDHYYFSILEKLVSERYEWALPKSFEEIEAFNPDVIVFNYPEKPFTPGEIEKILEWAKEGKGIGLFSYYLNEDDVTENVNRVLKSLGLEILTDEVKDPNSCYRGDDLLLVTDNLHPKLKEKGVKEVLLACTSSVKVDSTVVPLVRDKSGKKVLVAYKEVGKGRVIYGGTCVFWDNFSIEKYDNEAYSLAILDILANGL